MAKDFLWAGAASLAHRLEAAEAVQLERQALAYQALAPGRTVRVERFCGGIAALTDPAFGRKLNHVAGFGLEQVVTEDDLVALEALFHGRDLPVEIDLCPHADPTVLALLAARDYRVNAFSATYVRALGDIALTPAFPAGVEIRPMVPGDAADFIAVSAAGFSSNGRSADLLGTLAKLALDRADTEIHLAFVDGVLAGSAGFARLPTEEGPVAMLYIASTLSAYRGRGIQTALLQSRLAAARTQGIDLAMIGTRLDTPSSRNVERAGFRLAYVKPTFVKREPARMSIQGN